MLPAIIQKKLPDITVSLVSLAVPSLLAFIGYATCYMYELGYCLHFGVPRELIVFGIRDIVISLTSMFAALLVIVLLYGSMVTLRAAPWVKGFIPEGLEVGLALLGFTILYKGFFILAVGWMTVFMLAVRFIASAIDAWPSKRRWRVLAGAILLLGAFSFAAFAMRHDDDELAVGMAVALLLALLFVVVASIRVREVDEIEPINWASLKSPNGVKIALWMMLFLLIGAFGFGLGAAKNRSTFLTEVGVNNEALVAIYGPTAVFCGFELLDGGETRRLTNRIRIAPVTEGDGKEFVWTNVGTIETGDAASLAPYLQ